MLCKEIYKPKYDSALMYHHWVLFFSYGKYKHILVIINVMNIGLTTVFVYCRYLIFFPLLCYVEYSVHYCKMVACHLQLKHDIFSFIG